MQEQQNVPLDIKKEDFRKIGYSLIDAISEYNATINERPVTTGESPAQLQEIIGNSPLPEQGKSIGELIQHATEILFNHSLFNGHPKFFGYVTSSPAPIGALAELLAASVNPNVGAQILSPVATEIEKQTIRWLAEFIGLSPDYGGLLVSGGNMANFTAFLAGRTAKAPRNIKEIGISSSGRLIVYCSTATHLWIEKAAILFGMGSRSVHYIQADEHNRMDVKALERAIKKDMNDDFNPFMVVGNAGDVSTGVVDNLREIAEICKKNSLWFHVDGAYGISAAVLPHLKPMFDGLTEADSIALDPHKWWYSPLEAGCVLVKNPKYLLETFSSHPVYYNFEGNVEDPSQNYYEYGLQNSRGFKALKVWLMLQQVGRTGYQKMIADNIEQSKLLFKLAKNHPELEAVTHNLSITTFRYVPLKASIEVNLNKLNETLVNQLQQNGKLFVSNAMVGEKYCLRACIVNFRTTIKDIEETIDIVVKTGRIIFENTMVRNVNKSLFK